jgi:nucleotide-binding universal stress UspA family protein
LVENDPGSGDGMHKHILIPTDGSELSQNAVDYGAALAKSVNAKITLLTVSTPFHTFAVEPVMVTDTPEQYASHVAALAERYLSSAKRVVAETGVSCQTTHIEHDHPYRAIIETAERNRCDLIVMASHGRRGISAIVLGSETVKVLTHSTIPVLVVRAPQPIPSIGSFAS